MPADCILPSALGSPSPASAVFLPKEHGSWSLALEPLALGLLLAPSLAGAALATAAIAGFFARRPLKALFHDKPQRHHAALPAFVWLAVLAAAGLGEAALLGGPGALWPLLLAVPFGGLFLHFDAQNEARAAVAELAGCATFAFLPVALATLAGWPAPAALALLVLALTRSLPTVLTVRTYLRLQKRQPSGTLSPILAGTAALGLTALLTSQDILPRTSVVLAGLLLVRTGWFLSPLRPVLPAKRIGIIEAVIGVLYLGLLALAYHGE